MLVSHDVPFRVAVGEEDMSCGVREAHEELLLGGRWVNRDLPVSERG
jgi:hypothetical protein